MVTLLYGLVISTRAVTMEKLQYGLYVAGLDNVPPGHVNLTPYTTHYSSRFVTQYQINSRAL